MTPENTGKKQGGRFRPGQSGNPAGRPQGTRNKATLAVQALLDGEAEVITRKAMELARAGDMQAIRLVLERILPPRKDTPVSFPLPEINNADDAARVISAIMKAVAAGDITPLEAREVAGLVETYIKALETCELDARLKALEDRTK